MKVLLSTFFRRRLFRRGCAVAGISVLLLGIGWCLLPPVELYPSELSWSKVITDRNGEILQVTLAKDGHYRLRTGLADLHPSMVEATLAKEDRWFRRHPGVNPFSLVRALGGVLTGKPAGGGSTISMQVARMRWKLETRGVSGKLKQIFRALQLERHHSKDAILEAYFNLAPYGGNVEGVGAASLLWCGREPAALTSREAVALSVIPQSPMARSPATARGRARLATAQSRLMKDLAKKGEQWRGDPLAGEFTLEPPGPPPHHAMHFSRRLLANCAPDDSRLVATLDTRAQRVLETGIRHHLSRIADLGINNACAILVHAHTREVLAYVGSARYKDASIHGMVDGLRGRRSPGSALKPFVYGLALDQGLIHPGTLLVDGPMIFGDYNPENFEREFMGPISAVEALRRSRNIPAVHLAARLSGDGLYGLLQRGGVSMPKPESYYGLALALGGFGISPVELAGLYAALADDGRPRPLVYRKDLPINTGQAPAAPVAPVAPSQAPELFSAPARHLIIGMLSGITELGPETGYVRVNPDIAFKTGTSHGFRDAWAAGIHGDHVLVVWLGNFNGRGNNALVARKVAAPLLFDLFHQLALPANPRLVPDGVGEVEICAVSGQLPGRFCQHTKRIGFLPGISPITACDLHREILVDGTTGLRVATDDGRPGLRREVREFWSPDMLKLFQQAGLPRQPVPLPENGVATVEGSDHGEAPRILSPIGGRTYLANGRTSISLTARAAPAVNRLYWFDGEAFLGSSEPTTPMPWTPTPGRRRLKALDDHGRAGIIEIEVKREL